MINKVKNFLTAKRCKKLLKNNKGFSLLEVLVAVGIIGIISAIAYPSFDDYRQDAARTAANTSASNMVKAFRNCRILNDFTSCDTIGEIKMTCPDGAFCDEEVDDPKFCGYIRSGGDDPENDPNFSVCVSVDGSNVLRTYGGKLLSGKVKYCHVKNGTDCSTTSLNGKKHPGGSVKVCDDDGDCSTHGSACAGGTVAGRTCEDGNSEGKCNGSADCI